MKFQYNDTIEKNTKRKKENQTIHITEKSTHTGGEALGRIVRGRVIVTEV